MPGYMGKKSPQYELRTLLFSLLDSKIAYSGKTVPVYEAVPKGLPKPYIVIGDAKWDNQETKTTNEDGYQMQLLVFSDYHGTLENVAILSDVVGAISEAAITHTLQFGSTSDFCITMFYLMNGETRLISNDLVNQEALERSIQNLYFRVKQIR